MSAGSPDCRASSTARHRLQCCAPPRLRTKEVLQGARRKFRPLVRVQPRERRFELASNLGLADEKADKVLVNPQRVRAATTISSRANAQSSLLARFRSPARTPCVVAPSNATAPPPSTQISGPGGVPTRFCLAFAALLEFLQGECSCRSEESIARRIALDVRDHQRLLDQGRKQIGHVFSASSVSSPQTSSAASSCQPPAKIASCRKSRCSCRESRSWLQSISARIVC